MILEQHPFLVLWITSLLNPAEPKVTLHKAASKMYVSISLLFSTDLWPNCYYWYDSLKGVSTDIIPHSMLPDTVCWGNLVKSVIHVSRGHWKTKIPKCWKSYCFGYLVPVYTASDEKKTTGHLIAPFTNLLCLIQRIPMSPRDAYFLYHVFMLQVTCILHKSVVIDAIKIEFVYVRLSNGIVVFI